MIRLLIAVTAVALTAIPASADPVDLCVSLDSAKPPVVCLPVGGAGPIGPITR